MKNEIIPAKKIALSLRKSALRPAKKVPASVAARVRKHRDALRKAGMRPVQIWVPDTRNPDFAKECRRQSRIASKADKADTDIQQFMDDALKNIDGWVA